MKSSLNSFNLYTPVQELDVPQLNLSGASFFIKRDDLIHPFVSGNKWRKLKYNFQYALKEGKQTVVTFGGAFSNHLIATASAGAIYGLQTKGYVRGEELNANSNLVLRLCSEYGMDLEFITRSEYKKLKEGMAEHREENEYVIPEGGSNALGEKGCSEIIRDTENYDHITLAVGTGTTMLGILQTCDSKVKVHGFAAIGQADELKASIESAHSNAILHTEYAFGGFGKFDSRQLEFNKMFASTTGILLDPVYTGKMMRGVIDLANRGEFTPKSKVLCIHTGGLTGILSEKWLCG